MRITSDFKFDFPVFKEQPGSYEWWYFDAADERDEWNIVVIFYDGCPFSPRYNRQWKENPDLARAAHHPAVSISLYHKGEPFFYSMSEYEPVNAHFLSASDNLVEIRIGKNTLRLENLAGQLHHEISLDEELPSGDRLSGTLKFTSKHPETDLFGTNDKAGDMHGHGWNLTQPRAAVVAKLVLDSRKRGVLESEWKGTGYHDHNLGEEPMKQEFRDWYWGRFHFKNHTLVYYLMDTGRAENHKGWVLDRDNRIVCELTGGKLSTMMSNAFLLNCARVLELESPGKARVMIQQSRVMDSGPFYYRFRSDAILHLPGSEMIEQGSGITEYIRPSRIHTELFWPLVHMRYRYTDSPHWVQRSPRLYRWTW